MELSEQPRTSGLASRGAEQAAAPVNRLALLRTVRELRATLGLSLTDCAVLEKIVDSTARAAWESDTSQTPINYRRQQDMAAELGVSARHWRSIEAKLAARGLIERAATVNGWRGCAGGVASGLSCAPLRDRAAKLAALATEQAERRRHMAELRLTIGKLRRRAQRLAEDSPDTEAAAAYRAAAAAWPDRLRSLSTVADLQAHHDAVEAQLNALESGDLPSNTSGAAAPDNRRHIHNTHIKDSCSRSARTNQPAPHIEPTKTTHHATCNETSVAAGTALPPKLVARLDVAALRKLASEDLRFYIDHLRDPGTPRRLDDIEGAVLMRLPEIRISPQTYEAAQAALGWFDALLAVIVLDRNRAHPTRPVDNAGGALRAMIRRREAGELNLGASIHAIWQRDGAAAAAGPTP